MSNQKIENEVNKWKLKLQDITLRNRAINFKDTISTVHFIYPSLDQFLTSYDNVVEVAKLFDDNDILFEDAGENNSSKANGTLTRFGLSIEKKDVYKKGELNDIVDHYLSKNKRPVFITNLGASMQNKRLKGITKTANLLKEENAVDVLYLALGMLHWYESESSNLVLKSPLLFYRVQISQENIRSPFEINLADGELIVNYALIKKLENDFGLAINYEINDSKNLVDSYNEYKKLIQANLVEERWSIEDELNLSTFNFNNLMMIKDMEDNLERINNNKLIQTMIEGRQEESDFSNINESTIDNIINPADYFHAYEADSSQEIAIQAAIQGSSFVLQGPPGTGKSQTITNILSELIARAKKVLFVAEKKAALDVVYNNLKKINLATYALPVHDTKIDKKTVIKELQNTFEKSQHTALVSASFSEEQISKYTASKQKLRQYPDYLLNKIQPINKSLYELFGAYLGLDKILNVKFDVPNYQSLDANNLLAIEESLTNFHKALNVLNFEPEANIWNYINKKEINFFEEESLFDELNKVVLKLSNLINDIEAFDIFKFMENNKLSDFAIIKNYFIHLLTTPKFDEYLLMSNNVKDEYEKYKGLKMLFLKIKNVREQLTKLADLKILEIDENLHLNNLLSATNFFSKLFSGKYKKSKKLVLQYVKFSSKDDREIINLLNLINEYKKEVQLYKQLLIDLKVESKIKNVNDIDQIISLYAWYLKYRNYKSQLNVYASKNEINLFNKLNNDKEKLNNLITSFNNFEPLINYYLELFSNHESVKNLSFYDLEEKLKTQLNSRSDLIKIINYNKSYSELSNLNLLELVNFILENKIENDYFEIFKKRYYFLLIAKNMEQIPNDLSGINLDFAKETYSKTFNIIQKMSSTKIENNIVYQIPNSTGLSSLNVEVTTLKAESNKTRKLLPLRVLFNKLPTLLTKLKPILMMSPLAVSTYLKDNEIEFDTIIFDEASQVKPEYAMGAIFRGKQLIITGDQEQLPPTNFFNAMDDDDQVVEEDVISTNAFNSILEYANVFLKTIKLKWHYRSKYEELIRPSNIEIYKDLVTFPAIDEPKKYEGIKYQFVNGFFDGDSNDAESQAVIKLLEEIIKTNGDRYSIGVITFNSKQEDYIDRKLAQWRYQHPEYEHFFSKDKAEPFFIKNIETVQGDERDIIIISSVYGPKTPGGPISMNFGPINQETGYRRLNVAFTRAKLGTTIISSMHGSDIDLNRSNARGVRFLKNYLQDAEFGFEYKVDKIDENADFDSPFEEDVYGVLTSLGYEIKKQIGVSNYRIDLAIVDPSEPNKFILGIECDGATYHSAASVRDRDRSRQLVLEKRGWTIYRIWSTDWFKDRANQINKLDNYIKQLINNEGAAKVEQTQEEEIIIPIEIVEKQIEEANFETYPDYEAEAKVLNEIHKVIQNGLVNSYKMNGLAYENDLLKLIRRITPLHNDDFKKFATILMGKRSFNNEVEFKVGSLMRSFRRSAKLNFEDDYYFDSSENVEIKFKKYNGVYRRDIEHIHPIELTDGLITILDITKEMPLSKLENQLLLFTGYKGTSKRIKEFFANFFEQLVKDEIIKIDYDNDTVRLK